MNSSSASTKSSAIFAKLFLTEALLKFAVPILHGVTAYFAIIEHTMEARFVSGQQFVFLVSKPKAYHFRKLDRVAARRTEHAIIARK